MDTQAYPGEGLSPSQLIFALNEELKRAAQSPSCVAKDRLAISCGGRHADLLYSFTFDEVSQLERDASTALTTIHEWRNSFIHINRVPLEVLSLIATHLPSQKDHFRASFVCRHWRRTFLRHCALWSQLYLSKGEVYVKTLLERAKGSTLDVFSSCMDPVSAIALLFPHIKQVGYLDFIENRWVDIRMFSALTFSSGPLPLLRTLNINVAGITTSDSDVMNPPPPTLFSNATNLQEFRLRSEGSPFLNHFAFPNLTVFELSVAPVEELRASQLLDFLGASPMLQAVRMKIDGDIFLDGVPQERVVVLPNVESLCLGVSDGGPGYRLAAHISCPSAKHTTLTLEREYRATLQEVFPTSVTWNAIVRQYTRSPIREVILEIRTPPNVIKFSLTFWSPDATFIRLHFKTVASGEDEDEDWFEARFAAAYRKVFSQASKTIQDLPLLADVKRLHIRHGDSVPDYVQGAYIPIELRRLLRSVGPLEELAFYHCNMLQYFAPFFLDHPDLRDFRMLFPFPQVKELTISHPQYASRKDCATAIVRLAESQHALGVPFERVTIRMHNLPAETVERLRQWVDVADY